MYHFIERLHTLYGLLQDEQSKEIFQARFAIDMEKSIPNVSRLVLQGSNKELFFLGWPQSQKDALKQEHKKIFLYGTGIAGRLLAGMLKSEHIDFYGFCGRDAEEYPDGLLGKPVISSDELVAHKDEYCVVPAVIGKKAYMEISQFVREHNYPEKNLLGWADYNSMVEQYFEFPELYRRGTVFIDGGCCDCESSYRFAQWCEGEYSSIIAFEPDPDNYDKCCKKTQDAPLRNFQLVNAGLSSQAGTLTFNAQGTGQSHILFAESSAEYVADVDETDNKISIRTVAIDDIIGDRTVGFIKMDIEGAEFDALHGAKNTILRDKPHLAICVYHLRGDVFAIMDYLHQLLPEYRFWLRHYSPNDFETVLYASVDL